MSNSAISLSPSLEDYLEAIYRIASTRKVARVKEIAEALGVRMPSVTGAVRSLAEKNLVRHDKFGYVDLTDEGHQIAKHIVRRHEVIVSFLTEVLGLDAQKATEDGCKMEHTVSQETLERFARFIEFLHTCPRTGADWLSKFHETCRSGQNSAQCKKCIDDLVTEFETRRESARKEEMPASELDVGCKAVVVRVKGERNTRRRLLDMGLVPGTVVEVERVAPLGDPLDVKVKGYHLSLRKDEAAKIVVRPLS